MMKTMGSKLKNQPASDLWASVDILTGVEFILLHEVGEADALDA
jgi:hypothetical protein